MISPPAQPRTKSRTHARRGSVMVIVLWSVALGSVIALSVQFSAQRQAMTGNAALARVQARWAARAGVERMISILGYYTENPDPNDAFVLYREMANAAYSNQGDLLGAAYAVEHYEDGQVFAGPYDEHKRLNLNFALEQNPQALADLGMLPDLIDSLSDWIDSDDDPNPEGAEANQYLAQGFLYKPRNAYFRSIAEAELALGADVRSFREEDWNLNNRFDPNENDGQLTMPEDDANNQLDQGWAKYLTAYSVRGGLGASGLPKLYLRTATPDEVRDRLGISGDQAQALVNFGRNPANTNLSVLITASYQLPYIKDDGSPADLGGGFVNNALPLNGEELGKVFSELTLDDPSFRYPGKININTASPEVLELLGLDPAVVDEVVFKRDRSPTGFTNIMELMLVTQLLGDQLADIAQLMDTTSNVFTITSTGYSAIGDTQVQLIVVVDRSTLPVHVVEYREQ